MFPVGDVIPSRTTPYATIGLIALTAIVFAGELMLDADDLQRVMGEHGLVPARFSPWGMVTSLFLHVGWVHVTGNMLYLWIFGDSLEDRLGHLPYILTYLLCGTAAGIGHVLASPDSLVPMVGASGAVSGVLGAYIILYPHSRVLTAVFILLDLELVEIPVLYFLGLWFLMQLFSNIGGLGAGAADGAALWTHVAGFGSGAAVGGAVRRSNGLRYPSWTAGE